MFATPKRAAIRTSERGLSLVELLVVMLIIAILMAIGFSSVNSARSTGRMLAAMSAAESYGNAIDQFARDHRGRYPLGPGSADWPTDGPHRAGGGPAADVLGSHRYYLRMVPEAVQDATITFSGSGPARLSYRQLGGGAGYELTLTVDGRAPCAVRGGDTAGASSANECGRR